MSRKTKSLISLVIFVLVSVIGLVLNPPIEQKIVPQKQISEIAGVEGQVAQVIDVVDGDTIKVLINDQKYTVRLIGINTPETVAPRKPVECFGKEASKENKELLTDKQVILQKDISDTDKYGRLLRFVFLPLENGETLFVNDYLVREGFAQIDTFPPDVKYVDQFKAAEKDAREHLRGLWNSCQ